jgi:4'-phosphopantetheinyl transferase
MERMSRAAILENWAPAPADLAATRDEVHVWRIALEPPSTGIEPFLHVLSPDERVRADRFHLARDRGRFIVGRGALRTLLGRYLGTEPARLGFRYGPQGKPALSEGASLQFNLTHSQGLALLAVAEGREVGIDLEQVRPMADAERIISRFFSPRECADFLALPEPERLPAFFRGWTRKEAYIKARGLGFSMPLDQFDVTLAPDAPPQLLRVEGTPRETERWSFCDLAPGPGFLAAMAVEGVGWRLACFQDHALSSGG